MDAAAFYVTARDVCGLRTIKKKNYDKGACATLPVAVMRAEIEIELEIRSAYWVK
jgi:hypothetical protein